MGKLVDIYDMIASGQFSDKFSFKRTSWPEDSCCLLLPNGTIRFNNGRHRSGFSPDVEDLKADDWIWIDWRLDQRGIDSPLQPRPTKLLDEYARLLRRAWLNPSYKPWQDDVHRFERNHDLDTYFERWRKEDADGKG